MGDGKPPAAAAPFPGFGLLVAAGFLIVLAALVAAGWFLFIPRFDGRPIHETWALEALRDLAARQEDFRAARTLDADGDGNGEYGPLAALAVPGVDARGVDGRSHYVLRVFLPGGDGAERLWCAYAWQEQSDARLRSAFYIDQSGAIHQSANVAGMYTGPDRGPSWDAALPPGSGWGASPRAGAPASDGRNWTPLK